ncbi:hypothetical protein HBH98_188460 [Parastagonospora nodorum]|nr:hypothetical protein HBI10_065250 [Parastagonospora nodorum]KAH4028257.1 hypothetical protein HBI13_052790 [Parastagonospora nodorum]KAH4050987.1 hypothetical protein HBH49_126230 [Parastagonospora nodorum]KAH4227166.1 hypothetical protein HBI06_104050 [Parastagonospora nodorum]KAH4234017.1 hypothetical protein HBI05_159620 [Parastagonospora nodorum]
MCSPRPMRQFGRYGRYLKSVCSPYASLHLFGARGTASDSAKGALAWWWPQALHGVTGVKGFGPTSR